jgi:Oxidoreductase family, NAD-binding Rossmann fold
MRPGNPVTRIGIIGPARRRQGTGPYIARFLHHAGAQVVAVAASTYRSAVDAAMAMSAEFGYTVTPYPSSADMVDRGGLDAVAVCSPAPCHENHLTEALNSDISVFCEKPLLWSGQSGDAKRGSKLIREFRNRGVVLYCNTQWRFILEDVASLLGLQQVLRTNTLEMRLAPASFGSSMVPDAAPHVISLITALGGTSPLSKISACWYADQAGLGINAMAQRPGRPPLRVRMAFEVKSTQPRSAWINLDEIKIERVVTSINPYRMALRVGDIQTPIVDPLKRSVGAFLDQLSGPYRSFGPDLRAELAMLEQLWTHVAGEVGP